jgi:MoxR-like ATPase
MVSQRQDRQAGYSPEANLRHPATGAAPSVLLDSGGRIESLDDVRALARRIGDLCRAKVQGRDDVIVLALTALLADGHVLLEDHPGSGKTTLAKALGECISPSGKTGSVVSFRRIQFTPDLLPSDVTGTSFFDSQANRFIFNHGPVFANVLLADEINRTSPKVQAALLEAMAEKQVTADNKTYSLEELFFVIATQNPHDLAGTYPLPRAQLDRFLFKIKMTFLSRTSELEVLARRLSGHGQEHRVTVPAETLIEARHIIAGKVHVHPAIQECLVDLANALRDDRRVALGISTRSLVQAIPALQAWSMMHARDFVSPGDIKDLMVPLFAHRLELAAGNKNPEVVVRECAAPIIEALTRRTLARAG